MRWMTSRVISARPNLGRSPGNSARERAPPPGQGLTLVQFSAQRKHFLLDRGCIEGLLRGGYGGVRGYEGVFRVYFVSEMAQVEQKRGRV